MVNEEGCHAAGLETKGLMCVSRKNEEVSNQLSENLSQLHCGYWPVRVLLGS
jgi:hypothetical protein